MKDKVTSILRFVIPLAFGILLLYLAFKNISFQEFISKAKETDYLWVIISMVISVLAYGARAYRWRILLQPTGHEVSTYRLTLAVYIGYLANFAFPRLGEVTRCAVINRTDKVPVTISIGTVVSERVIDSLMLLLCLAFTFLIEFDLLVSYFDNVFSVYDINFGGLISIGIGGVVFSLGLFLFLLKSNHRLAFKIRSFLKDIWAGVSSIKDMTNPLGFVVSTLIMWATYYFMSYIVVFALEETASLSLTAGFMLLVTGGIATALPVQGGIGTYHAMVAMMLVLYGVTNTTGIYLATLLHTSQVIAIAIFGGLSTVLVFFIQKQNETSEGKNS